MSSEGKIHVVQEGDSIESLAEANGLFWETVWTHADNADLRNLRKKQNVLMPGDRVFIPDRAKKYETCDTDAKHTFIREGIPSELNVQFQDLNGEPYTNKPYRLLVEGKLIEGNLDGDGRLIMPIAPAVRKIHIEIGDNGELLDSDLFVGYLDPIEELTGVQARLLNLGFYAGGVDGNPSKALNDAIAEFRIAEGLDDAPDDDPDDKLFAEEEEEDDDADFESLRDDDSDDPTVLRGNDDEFREALRQAHGI